MLTYALRRNLFEKAEWTWRVEDDALVATDHLGRDDIGPWSEVTGVRIAFAPTRYKTWRHVLVLKFRNGVKWTIDNVHFAGVGSFEDRSATYAPFVREVVAKIADKAPDARASLGATPVGYWLSMAFLTIVFGALALVLMAVPIDGIPGVVFVKLAIIAFFMPTLGAWMVKSRPRGVRLGEIPESALPKAG